jgi:GNAT superfamily N-acetyltransferase
MQSDTVYRFKLDDGSEVRVRRETPDDLPLMIDLFEHVSPEGRLDPAGSHPESPDHAAAVQEATRLAELDRGGSVAWLAFADRPDRASVPVAGGRYTLSESGPVELSVVVRDDMQRQGIGSRLLYFVLDQARADGIGEAKTSFESGNEAAWQVLQYSPYHITWQPCGKQVEVMIHLQARTSPSASLN